jgi:hypothetical protein
MRAVIVTPEVFVPDSIKTALKRAILVPNPPGNLANASIGHRKIVDRLNK